jgi:hypothetical protein
MLYALHLRRRDLITPEKENELLEKLDKLSQKIANLRKILKYFE